MRLRRVERAFSLVELVLVIAILSIVTAIAVTRYTKGSETAKANALLQTLETIRETGGSLCPRA